MLSAALLLALAATPSGDAKLAPELRAAVRTAAPARRFTAYAVVEGRLDGAALRAAVKGLPARARAPRVAGLLRARAAERQGPLLALLDALRADGEVGRVESLWAANAVVFEGTRSALAAVAARPEVERVGWDPPRPAEERRDAPPFSGPSAPLWAEDFESGRLPPELSVAATGCGFAEVTDAYDPAQGEHHLVLGASSFPCPSTVSVTLALDLSGARSVTLRQRFESLLDEFDPGLDVLEASDDGGASWVFVADLDGVPGESVVEEHPLDPLGLDYGPGFRLRWSWSDNGGPPTDGFALDDLVLGEDLRPLEPPEPEPNLAQLQAPDLWELGVDGSGVVVLCVDDGVDGTHPDLAGALWSNPREPVNGVDDDGNGYVDDVVGWDFVDGDADPSPPSFVSHGTATAGILVGDGSSGVALTGMAPGAALAVARIDRETHHWLALQWGLSVGVDVVSSSWSFKWTESPRPDYAMHRAVSEALLAAGIVHANSIGNQGLDTASAPVPFNVSAPGLCPGPWVHPEQTQEDLGRAAVLACGAIGLDDAHEPTSSHGPSAWEDLALYDPVYPHAQERAYFDAPVGGFGGGGQGVLKPDLVAYTNVRTTLNDGGFGTFGGTSAAAPHLGGALALLRDAQPAAAPRHLAQALQVTAVDLGEPGKDPLFGAGKLQVRDAALRLLHLVRAADLAPSVGGALELELLGPPGRPFRAFFSTAGYGATPLGAGGVLDLAAPVLLLASGELSAAEPDGPGTARVRVEVPPRPALAGLSLLVQSVADDREGRSGTVLLSTIERVVLSN